MPTKPRSYSIILRHGLAGPEIAMLEPMTKRIVTASGEKLLMLECSKLEALGGPFAQITVINPKDERLVYDVWLPTHFVLMVLESAESSTIPFGFTEI
jgi:hypothetical protein